MAETGFHSLLVFICMHTACVRQSSTLIIGFHIHYFLLHYPIICFPAKSYFYQEYVSIIIWLWSTFLSLSLLMTKSKTPSKPFQSHYVVLVFVCLAFRCITETCFYASQK